MRPAWDTLQTKDLALLVLRPGIEQLRPAPMAEIGLSLPHRGLSLVKLQQRLFVPLVQSFNLLQHELAFLVVKHDPFVQHRDKQRLGLPPWGEFHSLQSLSASDHRADQSSAVRCHVVDNVGRKALGV